MSTAPEKFDAMKEGLPLKRQFPGRIVIGALLVTGIAFSALGLYTYDFYQVMKETIEQELQLKELAGRIVHLDEVRTMSARMAAATGAAEWEERYRESEPKLGASVQAAAELMPEVYSEEAVRRMDEAHLQLAAMENESFALVRQEKLWEARAILFGIEYETQKEIYANGIQEFVRLLELNLNKILDQQQKKLFLAVPLLAGSFLVTLIAWLIVIRLFRQRGSALEALVQRMMEQARQLKELNLTLDRRVENRTQEVKAQRSAALNMMADAVEARRRAEEAQAEAARLASFPEENPNPVIETDASGSVTYMNQPAYKEFPDLSPPASQHPILAGIPSALEALMKEKGRTYIHQIKLGDKIYEQQISVGPRRRLVRLYISDITARKRSEEEIQRAYEKLRTTQQELVQSEKLAALGRFSAGLAHEVKNPLGIILGWVEFLERKFPESDTDAHEAINIIKTAVHRADGIVRSLLRFSRPAKLQVEKIPVGEVIDETVSMLEHRLRAHGVAVHKDFQEGKDLKILVDKNQIQQVLFNLLTNASDAISKKGEIKIKVYSLNSNSGSTSYPQCAIEVTDTGEGISKENLARIFEPFYTTRREQKGTGLGLSVSKTIVENLGGELTIVSEGGKGTTAKVLLPLAA